VAQLQVSGAVAAPNTIDFDITQPAPATIAPASTLPTGAAPFVIDGKAER
jgi:hypothetical protein